MSKLSLSFMHFYSINGALYCDPECSVYVVLLLQESKLLDKHDIL